MCYTEEEIEKYLEILNNYNKQAVEDEKRKVRRWNCHSDCFFVNLGYKICDSCGSTNRHVLGYNDQKDNDRLHFQKKSIYQRKYHYEKKVDQVSKRLHLTEEQKYCLDKKLKAIDDHVMKILNKRFCRKRMISIFLSDKNIPGRNGKWKVQTSLFKDF